MNDSEEEEEQTALVCDNGNYFIFLFDREKKNIRKSELSTPSFKTKSGISLTSKKQGQPQEIVIDLCNRKLGESDPIHELAGFRNLYTQALIDNLNSQRHFLTAKIVKWSDTSNKFSS